MNRSVRTMMGLGILAATLGIGGVASAMTTWGPWAPTQSAPVTDNNPNGDKVTIQASVFNGSAFATVNSNTGPYQNALELKCSDGSEQAQVVNGTNTSNGNLAFFCPFFTSAVVGLGGITSN